MLAGDVHPNPGPPSCLCSVCGTNITRRLRSVKCTACNEWCHLKCSGLRRTRDYPTDFVGPCCRTIAPAPQISTQPDRSPSLIVNSQVFIRPINLSPSNNAGMCDTPATNPVATHITASLLPSSATNITPQPSPTYGTCAVCHENLTKRHIPIKCTRCNKLCHLKCSGLRRSKDYHPRFIGPCCSSSLPGRQPDTLDSTSVTSSETTLTPNATPLASAYSPQPNPRPSPFSAPLSAVFDHISPLFSHPSRPPSTTPTQTHSPHLNATLSCLHSLGPSNDPHIALSLSEDFKILQWNCNGLSGKIVQLTDYMVRNSIVIAALQETKLTNRSPLASCACFNIIRTDRGRDSGGGLAFVVHKSVQYQKLSLPSANDPYLETQGIAVRSGDTIIEILNVYIPPVASCESGYRPSIQHLLEGENRLVLGDFNAHHESWYSALGNDTRGHYVAELVDDSTLCVINEDHPTRIDASCSSSPDLTLAGPSLAAITTWEAVIALNSDHLPIIVGVAKSADFIAAERRSFINFGKANWEEFTAFTEAEFDALPLPTSVCEGEKALRTVITHAASRFIPRGRIPNIWPNFPSKAACLARTRDQLRSEDASDPRIPVINKEIDKLVRDHCRSKWLKHLEGAELSNKKLWKTIKSLNNKAKLEDNCSISFNGAMVSDATKCATLFNRQFVEHPPSVVKLKRATMRGIRKLRPCLGDDGIDISAEEVHAAILKAKPSRALGPDGIATIMLKHLGPTGIRYMTVVFNLCLTSFNIPDIWKVGKIIPVHKQGKPNDQGESYRPITLLSPVVKILEALVLPHLIEHLPLADHQHGFRSGRSTTSALCELTTHIAAGINQKRPHLRTIAVALDLSKAFDTVNHALLLKDLSETSLPNTIKRWLAVYMSGRQSFVSFRDRTSKYRKLKQGVPQGGVLSPILFNFYVSKMPTPPPSMKLISYADDCTIAASHRKIGVITGWINEYLPILTQFFTKRNLQLAPHKSTATLFTTWTKEISLNLGIHINSVPIPTNRNPKILGVTFDGDLKFHKHAEEVTRRVKAGNKVLKALSGSSWGKDKETLSTTYKAISRSHMNYAVPIWFPCISDTQWDNLQRSQNAALRTITGCHKMTHPDNLHRESSIIPVRDHCRLLTQQYVLRCHVEDHPNRHVVHTPRPFRSIRYNLHDVIQSVKNLVNRVTLNKGNLRQVMDIAHTEVVASTISSYKENIVLGGRPPPIDVSETSLPRKTRTTLAQLRSGVSMFLNSYLARVNPDVSDTCPLCSNGPHDTAHLFNCPKNPTDLTPVMLWTHPIQVASFLGLDLDSKDTPASN